MSSQSSPALFSTFIMSLASASLIELGVLEDPTTHKKRINKESARQHIEILNVLQEKTRGNLSPDEKELLEKVLTDVRLEFVKVASQNPSSGSKLEKK